MPGETRNRTCSLDPSLCAGLEAVVRNPSSLPLDQYERKLDLYFANYCHRNEAAGWKRDKRVRDTGPFTAPSTDGRGSAATAALHAPVVIWYSPEMIAWLQANRAGGRGAGPATAGAGPRRRRSWSRRCSRRRPPPAPASIPCSCFPTSGAAVMVRDPGGLA